MMICLQRHHFVRLFLHCNTHLPFFNHTDNCLERDLDVLGLDDHCTEEFSDVEDSFHVFLVYVGGMLVVELYDSDWEDLAEYFFIFDGAHEEVVYVVVLEFDKVINLGVVWAVFCKFHAEEALSDFVEAGLTVGCDLTYYLICRICLLCLEIIDYCDSIGS